MKHRCRNCNREFIHNSCNVFYCSHACNYEYSKVRNRKKRAMNHWLVYWKYKPTEMRKGVVQIEDLVDREIYKVCDYHFINDRFINNKAYENNITYTIKSN